MKTTKPNFTVKKSKKPINKTSKFKKKDITRTIEKRYNILIVVIIFIILVLGIGLFYAQIMKKNFYIEKLSELTQNITYGDTAPRGRIYDRNHRLIVDNKPVKVIYYVAPTGITTKEEIEEAYMVADMIDVDFSDLSEYNLKYFFLKNYPDECKKKITDEEWDLYDARKLSLDDIQDLKIERISEEDLSIYEDRDKEAAYIYYLMNNGYYFDEKIIKKNDVTDEEYALISENINVLKGFDTKLDWEREYLYGNTFKGILGSVSSIPDEKRDEFLEKGYELNDRVGTTSLEYQYEDYLRGTKNKYEILDNGTKKLIEEGSRGNDIVLTIDIELQQAVDQIIIDSLYWAKSQPNTEYFDRAYVVVLEPNTGEVLAMSSKKIVKTGDTYIIEDNSYGVITEPITIGSAVKGASHIVGYNTGALQIGETRNDFCIKIAATPEKCSWTTLGRLNDVTALMYSSNSFQYQTAIKVGGGSYAYNRPLYVNLEAFDIYRNTFKEFGLGTLTGIDLPDGYEDTGYTSDEKSAGLLLDFSIGQYDTYTPIQLAQYVSTMANGGNRMQPHLLKEVYSSKDNSLLFTFEPVILNTVNTKPEYIDRVKQGFKAVLSPGGTGSDYMPSYINPAGKTGTSESVIEGGVETLNHTFVGFAPYDNPRFAMAVLSPNVFHYNGKSSYTARVNRKISYEVAKKFFEIYG